MHDPGAAVRRTIEIKALGEGPNSSLIRRPKREGGISKRIDSAVGFRSITLS
ncbi:MAG: hypothetical protein WBF18_12185 [Solirubrobacterales bacterium]